jgi:hypothetical protein
MILKKWVCNDRYCTPMKKKNAPVRFAIERSAHLTGIKKTIDGYANEASANPKKKKTRLAGVQKGQLQTHRC